MEPMYLSIRQKETGKQIKKLLMENGYTVKDVQNAMGFENPQAQRADRTGHRAVPAFRRRFRFV